MWRTSIRNFFGEGSRNAGRRLLFHGWKLRSEIDRITGGGLDGSTRISRADKRVLISGLGKPVLALKGKSLETS